MRLLRLSNLPFALLLGGCATTATVARPAPVATPVRAPSCRPRARLLAPPASAPAAPVIASVDTGWVMAWSERAGERSALRFLYVDRLGIPRSPSAEVVDLPARIAAPAVAVDGDGYLVSWSEEGATQRHERRVDQRGRARSDVAPTDKVPAPVAASGCTSSASGVRCTTGTGSPLDLPASEHPASESLDKLGLAVIASSEEGLRLWVLDCGAR